MSKSGRSPCLVYFAGPLFDHKHLIGNKMLADALTAISHGRYSCLLPQDCGEKARRAREIRNDDLRSLMEANAAVFSFDGAELDAGVVVEFVFAKMLDIPAVVLRTDRRSGGERDLGDEPWNLMLSAYPRTTVLILDSMALYCRARKKADAGEEAVRMFVSCLAKRTIQALDQARRQAPVFDGDVEFVYRWASRFPNTEPLLSDAEVRELLRRKQRASL